MGKLLVCQGNIVTYPEHKDMEGSIHGGVPPNGWFIKENPIERDDLEVPLFQETSTQISYMENIFGV